MGHKGSKHRQNEELKRTKEAFDELDLNRDGFITEDDVKKNLLKDVANMVAEAEQAKQKELEAEVRNTLGNAVKGLNKKLEITATTKEMTDALVVLQQTFSVAVKESTKKAGAAQKEAFLKEADKRAKVIFDKADADRDKKIDFEEYKVLLGDQEKLAFFLKAFDTPLDKVCKIDINF